MSESPIPSLVRIVSLYINRHKSSSVCLSFLLTFFPFFYKISIFCVQAQRKATEAYRSGHNGPDSKSGRPQGLVGSNPTAFAKKMDAPNGVRCVYFFAKGSGLELEFNILLPAPKKRQLNPCGWAAASFLPFSCERDSFMIGHAAGFSNLLLTGLIFLRRHFR